MDAGIATEANIAWLAAHQYRYLVVSRERARQFDPTQAVEVLTAADETVRLQRVVSEDGREVRLHCHSAGREAKERAITERFSKRFEAALARLAEGLTRPRGKKDLTTVQQRIGGLKKSSHGIGQHYDITVVPDETGANAVAITWTRMPVAGTMLTDPGVYCLRSNELAWDAPTLWRTYMTLTDLEAVFRSLKSELGLRPVFHHRADRTDGHLFITVLAYQLVQVIRRKLAAQDQHLSWSGLRAILAVQ
jgi:transposase